MMGPGEYPEYKMLEKPVSMHAGKVPDLLYKAWHEGDWEVVCFIPSASQFEAGHFLLRRYVG